MDEYDSRSDLAQWHRVRAVPCFLFMDGGAVVSVALLAKPFEILCRMPLCIYGDVVEGERISILGSYGYACKGLSLTITLC